MIHAAITRRELLAATGLTLAGISVLGWSAVAQEATPIPDAPTLVPLPDAAPRTDGPLAVVATTPILADIARQIGGVRVEVESLLPPNADPHDFEPAPADIVAIEDADLVIEHGLTLDSWASDLVSTAGSKNVVTATDGVPTLSSDEEGFTSGDPHVWFDPTNVKIMASNIAAALTAIDEDGAASYSARLDGYHLQIDALDQWIAAQIATIPTERRKLVTNHDAFGYYVRRYGLTFVGSVIPSIDTKSEPSAKETADLIEKIKSEGVPAIFTEASLNPELEDELAKQAGVKVVPDLYGDNLGEAGSGADTYIGFMVTDTLLIVNALR
jgi:ABC-type Zn uptake system ZnuABC Zn-binding protein ZnuA